MLGHTVSRNILPRCENLLFNFFPLKGKKHTHNNHPHHHHLPCCSTGWETKPVVNDCTHRHCPLPRRVLRGPGCGGGEPGAVPHLPRHPGHARFSASAPRKCQDPALSRGVLQGICRYFFAVWGGLGSSVCPPGNLYALTCVFVGDCECPGQAVPACVCSCVFSPEE